MGKFSSRSQPRRDGEAESDAEEESGSSGSGTATQQTETGEHETEDLQRATAATQAPTSTTGGESPGDGGGETSERTAPGIGRRLAPETDSTNAVACGKRLAPETDSTNAVACGKRLAPEIDSSQSGPSKGVSSRTRLSEATRAYGDNSATDYAGETDVPDTVRDVISSPGQSLDADIQRTMENEMGDSFSDVQVHTGPQAVQACEDINAKAFTVGNNIAFNQGEYDPGSVEGQHTIAHELAHVRQQTGGAVSMLPQEDVELEIDPDPELEQEAEETAQRVMEGGELGIHRMAETEVHIQRSPEQTGFDEDGNFNAESVDRDNLPESMQDEEPEELSLIEVAKHVGRGSGRTAILTGLSAIVTSGGFEQAMQHPEGVVTVAGVVVPAAVIYDGWTNIFAQVNEEMVRQMFEAAGKEELFDKILDRVGGGSDTGDYPEGGK